MAGPWACHAGHKSDPASPGDGDDAATRDAGTPSDATQGPADASSETGGPGSPTDASDATMDGSAAFGPKDGDGPDGSGRDSGGTDAGGAPPPLLEVAQDHSALGTLAVDASDLYWTRFDGGLMRMPKDGSGEPELIATGAGAGPVGLIADGTSVYWPSGEGVAVLHLSDRSTDELPFGSTLQGVSMVDGGDTLYVVSRGCADMLSVPKDGTAPVAATFAINFEGGVLTAAQDDDYFYCSTGAEGSMVRRAKVGGAIERITHVPDPNDLYGQQVGGMAVVGETMYFIVHFSSLGQRRHFLAKVPRSGGDAEVLLEVDNVSQVAVLHHDPARNALFWLARSQPIGVIRYDLADGTISRRPIALPTSSGAMATDADFIYAVGNRTIARLPKW